MADDDERPLPAAQGLFQPFDGGHIQVIGRFVEDEQVWFFQEQAAQKQARLLAAAEMGERRFPLSLGETEAKEYALDVILVLVATIEFVLVLETAVCRQHPLRHFPATHNHFQLSHLPFQQVQIAKNSQHLLKNRIVLPGKRQRSFLLQIAQRQASGAINGSGCWLVETRQNEQQRRFAAAVWPHQPHALFPLQLQADPAKNIVRAKGLAQFKCG